MKLQINNSDADDFVDCWRKTIGERFFVEPYNPEKGALVFSFDNEMKPFLNYTKGYHRHRERRPYFERIPRIMREIWGNDVAFARNGRPRVY